MSDNKKRGYVEGYTFVDSIDKLPPSTHFAVIESSTIQTDDTYGGLNSTKIVNYIAMADKEALEDYILNRNNQKPYKVIQVKPVEVSLHTTVSIKE